MEHIRLLSTTCVQPQQTHDNQLTKIELSPTDVQPLLRPPIQKGILFHKPKPDHEILHQNGLNLIEHLKASFSSALVIFYPFAGRLAVTENHDNTTTFSLDCNGAGAQFDHAAADGVTVSDILDPLYIPDDIIYSLFPLNGVRNYEASSKPLLAVQVTELVDGIFIGMSLNHCIGDGTSFWKFFNTWSEISRCGETSLAPPIFSRDFLDGIVDLPVKIPNFRDLLVPEVKPSPSPPLPPVKQKIFHFSKEKIALIKSMANAQNGTNKISSLQAVMGYLWTSITQIRRRLNPNLDQETSYVVPLGTRQRVHPPLTANHIANSVVFGVATSNVDNVADGGLGFAAMELNKMITSYTPEVVTKILKDWGENPSIRKSITVGKSNVLYIGSSPRFNIYGNDFGWGKPAAVRSGSSNKFDGKMAVYPGAQEGSIDFEACLSVRTLEELAEDADFHGHVVRDLLH